MIWRELNRETAAHGLAVTGGAISTTGIAGLTLGGGLGWLMSKHGLAADNLTRRRARQGGRNDRRRDGGLRSRICSGRSAGAAGTSGSRPRSSTVCIRSKWSSAGLIAHPIDAAGDMLRFYRDAAAAASDDLTVFAAVVHAPDGSGAKIAGMVVFHTGTPEVAERELAPFKEWGSPLVVEVGPMPYPVMNTILDDGYPTGSLNYWLSSFTAGRLRRVDRHDRRPLPVRALTDDRDPARALPRRRLPCRRRGDGEFHTAKPAGTC